MSNSSLTSAAPTSAPSEMVERVARAIFKGRWESTTVRGIARPWESADVFEQGVAIGQAIAAIKALREPTENMLQAGYIDSGESWPQMIDAALSDDGALEDPE